MEKEIQMKVSDNLEVSVIADLKHEFLMTTAEVAKGYGINANTLRGHKFDHKDELIEGKHFITCVQDLDSHVAKRNADTKSATYKQILWTKRGIIRLGFFIKSERAKLFRDWAEDLVIRVSEIVESGQQLSLWPESPHRKHNRLTRDRLVDILADVARIEDKELRLSLVEKLLNQK